MDGKEIECAGPNPPLQSSVLTLVGNRTNAVGGHFRIFLNMVCADRSPFLFSGRGFVVPRVIAPGSNVCLGLGWNFGRFKAFTGKKMVLMSRNPLVWFISFRINGSNSIRRTCAEQYASRALFASGIESSNRVSISRIILWKSRSPCASP